MPRRRVPRRWRRHRLSRTQARHRALIGDPASWFEVALECGPAAVDAVCEALEAFGAASVTIEDAGDDPQLEPQPGTTPLWARVRIRALYEHPVDAEPMSSKLPLVALVTNVRVREIASRDWLAAAREDIEPFEVGALWIGPEWADPPRDRVVVRLEPGLAFGSGRHPSTRLCLERLAAKPPVGVDVIDYGCGSGILAVAAAALGARRVFAFDVDPQALRATADNARRNGVSNRVSVVAAGPATSGSEVAPAMPPAGANDSADGGPTASGPDVEPAMLVVANIVSGTLVELAPTLSSLTRPGGDLVLSGILEAQTGAVAGAYHRAFDLRVGGESDGWVRLDGRRRSRRDETTTIGSDTGS